MKKYFLLLCFGLLGCASFSVSKYSNDNYAPTNPINIKIFQNMPPNKDDYLVIGEVNSSGAPLSNRSSMIERIKEKAAEIGGDVIVLNHQEVFSGMSGGGNSYNYGYGYTNYNMNTTAQYAPQMNGIILRYKNRATEIIESGKVSFLINRGNQYGRKGDCENAILDYNKAIELNPKAFEAYAGKANCLAIEKKYEESIDSSKKAIELTPDKSGDLYFNIGLVYDEGMNQKEDAIEAYNNSLKHSEDKKLINKAKRRIAKLEKN